MTLELVSDQAIIEMGDAIDVTGAVRDALIAASDACAVSFPVLRAHGAEPVQAVNLKFGAAASAGLVGGKVGTFWPGNAARGVPNHSATTLLLDPETGRLRAIVAAMTLNRRRTAAADALAVDALARPKAAVLTVVGAGGQSIWEARAIAAVRTLSEIRVVSRSLASAQCAASRMSGLAPFIRPMNDVRRAVNDADIIVTATPSKAPLIETGWLRPGAHLSAMGADARGKREVEIAAGAALFADLPDQAFEVGEFQHLDPGVRPQVTPLGEVLAGRSPGRTSPDQITVFDSSGLAAQDLFAAEAALQAARRAGLVQVLEF